jgi:inward rectifier potassium channel
MNQTSVDPGLGEKYLSRASRLINNDGSFNIKRIGTGFHHKDLYQYLINQTWPIFFSIVFSVYLFLNTAFASIYYLIGTDSIRGAHFTKSLNSFLDVFFFSVQTFTTVGYGGMIPNGVITNIIAAFEAMTGLLAFAIITGLLYGRFSKPSARILYSNNLLLTKHQNQNALMFRIANQRNNNLMELEAKVLFSYIDFSTADKVRKYIDLKLERAGVYFFPLNWTLVHIIDRESALFGKSAEDLAKMHAEFLILVKGFDDTFSQTVHSRYSYKHDEIIWGAKFIKPYLTNHTGTIIFDLNDIHKFEIMPLN